MKKIIAFAIFSFGMHSGMHAQESQVAEGQEIKAYLVSTAHFDTQWNWDVRESIDDYLYRTMVQNFWLFERFPNYVFNFESAQKYVWMKEYYPREYEKVRHYIKLGRWNVVGSCWEANDPNVPSSESFFRNVLLGQEFYKREFGVKSNDIYLPDCFGFGYTMPTIASHCGIIGFSTQKLQWRKNVFFGELPPSDDPDKYKGMWSIPNKYKIPFPIGFWKGIDDSQIMAALDTGGYGTSFYYDDITSNKRIINRALENPNNTAYVYYGVGDRGGSPTLASVYSLENALVSDGPVKVISARGGQMYEDYLPFENHPELPVYQGELTMDVHGVGCYSSQAALKLFNRNNELLADAAERASVIAELMGGINYPAEEMRDNWHRLLWHQFHDDITGTSIPRSYTFTWNDHLVLQNRLRDAITNAVGAVSRSLDTRTNGTPVVVYNPVETSRKDVVVMNIPMASCPQAVQVTSPKGRVPAQLLSWKDGVAEVIFSASVEPLSFTVFDVKASAKAADSALKVSANSLENRIYRLTLDENGDIASIIDKRYGKELVKEGEPFRLAVLTEHVSMEYPAWEIYKTAVDGKSVSVTENVKISIAERGPLRASLRIERDYEGSHIVQYISMTDGAADERIEIANEVEWRAKGVLLKAEFPTSLSNEKTAYDLGMGHIWRGVNTDTAFEVIGHQWADLTDEDQSYGISIFNDSKYGWDKPDENTIRLTLLNTPGCEGSFYHYQGHQDHGFHIFKYAIVGHEGSFIENDIAGKAMQFNQRLTAFSVPKHKGVNGKSYSFARVDNSQIAIKAIKKAEDGTGYIIRINEIDGSSYENAAVIFDFPIAGAIETNGIEEVQRPALFEGNKLIFSGKAFQPRTFKVTFKNNPVLTVPENSFVDLEYNAVAFTADAFNRAGNFDGRGNSLAAELMPEIVVSDGIEFNINNDPAVKDFVRADGQTVNLPENHGADKLYLLVTSVNGDRKATFKVDGKEYEVNVPYYTDFFGQWGWEGESDGYLKDGSFGYIANHKHSERKGNDSYSLAYLYKVCLPIGPETKTLELPEDAGIALFAVTLTDNENQNAKPLTEMRIIPKQTKEIVYTAEPMKFFNERSAW